jgi:hypothetical protein
MFLSRVCVIRTVLYLISSKMRSGFEEVTLVQRLGQVAILRKACDCKVARRTYLGYRYYTL